jgi:uncharacterized protein YkwD
VGRIAAVLTAVALLIAGLATCSGPSSPDSGPRLESTEVPSPIAASLAELTNGERKRAGLRPLQIDSRLMRAAETQAEQVAAAGRMAHTLPDAPYPTMEARLAAVGYAWQAAGENLAFGQHSAAEVVAGWMQSPAHRANMLAPHFTQIGTGHFVGTSGRAYYVQVFGAPR